MLYILLVTSTQAEWKCVQYVCVHKPVYFNQSLLYTYKFRWYTNEHIYLPFYGNCEFFLELREFSFLISER